ncbi:MAG: tetratricopeptide repeat protein [Planctomycetota bacterium]|jgi:tetratricopeptide (TPR) repeat protein|nr:tetratricopeptide repeat protein [Planctomycetota bacterium]
MGEPNQNIPIKKLLCLSILFPAAVLLVLEGACRLLWPVDGAYRVFMRDGDELVVRPEYRGAFHALRFAERKPEGTVRILCLGGSSTYGFPFGKETAFGHWLHHQLGDHPEKKWEVLNLGAMSYGTHRILDLMPEFLRLQPDVILLYAGHNEFVERTHGAGRREPGGLRSVQLLRKMFSPKQATNPAEVYRETVHLSSEQERDVVIARFRENYREIIALAQNDRVPIIVSTMPSSLKDWRPDASRLFRLKEQKAWKEKYEKAGQLLDSEEYDDALVLLNELEELDPTHAEVHFRKGQCLLRIGDMTRHPVRVKETLEKAREAFTEARDNDASPQRALSGINKAIRELAASANVPCVDAVQSFAAHSENGITGKKLIEDYVHPTLKGHRLLATEFYVALHKRLKLGGQPLPKTVFRTLNELPAPEPSGPARASFFYNLGLKFINQENWPKVIETNRQAIRFDPSHALAFNNLGRGYQQTGELKTALDCYQKAAAIRPDISGIHRNLATLFQILGKLDEAEAAAQKAVTLRSDDASAHYLYATILAAHERTEESIKHYKSAARLKPDYFEAHANLGLAYALMGQNENARSAWKEALEIRPGEPVVSDWLRKLK